MRISCLLGASALLSIAQANSFDRRQSSGGDGGNSGGNAGDSSSSFSVTSSNPGPTDTSTSDNGGGGGQDVTTTITTTVTPTGTASTKVITISTTSTSVVTNTKTEKITDTITSNVDLATDTEYTTVTVSPTANARRYAPAGPITAAPTPTNVAQRNVIEKRDTITQVETVTADGDSGSVVTSTVTKSTVIISPTETTTTVHVKKYANAKSTTTITSTETVTASGAITPTNEPSTGNKKNDSSLSTGAKAGIGAGVGVAALVAILLGACCFWRRKRNQPKAYPDLMEGASVVPVGGPSGSTNNRPMTHNSASTAGYLAPGRAATNSQTSREGYRGTAMGDGRAGYAKPDAYGASYAQTPSRSTTTATGHASRHSGGGGADSLPEHPHPGGEMRDVPIGGVAGVSPLTAKTTPSPQPGAYQQYAAPPAHNAVELGSDNANAARWHNNDAAEIDSQPVMSHKSGPVYEMA